MVLTTNQNAGRQTTTTSTEREHSLPAFRSKEASSAGEKTQSDGMSVIQSSLDNQGVHSRLNNSSSVHGEMVPGNNIEHFGKNGKSLLVNNLLIPFAHL